MTQVELLAVHIMHTALVSGWAGSMGSLRSSYFRSIGSNFKPHVETRHVCYAFMTRLGVTESWGGWSVTGESSSNPGLWSFEGVCIKLILSYLRLLFLAANLALGFWDLEIFTIKRSEEISLDLPKVFGIHLFLSGLLCLGFGAFHVTGFFGPGMWLSDAYGLTGKSSGCYTSMGT